MEWSALTREAFGGLGVPCWAQEKIERVPFRVDGSIEIRPRFFDLDVGFIDAPGVIGSFEVRPAAFLQLGGIALHESGKWWYGPPAIPVPASFPPDRGSSRNNASTSARTAK